MSSAIEEFDRLVRTLSKEDGVSSGQMFGKACLKVNAMSLPNSSLDS